MMYYPDHNIYFTAHHKVASSSLYKLFGNKWAGSSLNLLGRSENIKRTPDMKEITFVRNPYDRIVSQWFYATEPGRGMDGYKDYTFEKWITEHPPLFNHVAPQFDDIGKDPYFIGRFENLENDLKFILADIGITDYKLPHKNKSENRKDKDYRHMFTPTTRKIVKSWFLADLERFDYHF